MSSVQLNTAQLIATFPGNASSEAVATLKQLQEEAGYSIRYILEYQPEDYDAPEGYFCIYGSKLP